MRSHARLIHCLLSIGVLIIPAAAQSTGREVRPEVGIYVQQGPLVRLESVDSASSNQNTGEWQGRFDFYVEVALKPVFRRELRDQPDVCRNKYLTVRAGYRYVTGLTSGSSTSENSGILEANSRYLLPWQLVISDRNRGEFRLIKGQGFSTRYRNRLRLERDIQYRWLSCAPHVYDEIFTTRVIRPVDA
jgi:hypothetical protein